jgi:hypothetical protein
VAKNWDLTLPLLGGADAVVGDEGFWIGEIRRDAGGGDDFAAFDALCDFEIEVEQLLEEVLFGREAVGGQHRVVECGVGVLEEILAGEFERAINGPQAAFDSL